MGEIPVMRRPMRAALAPLLCLVVVVMVAATMLPASAAPDSQSDKWSVDGLVDKATGSTTTTKPPPTTTTTRPRKPPGTTTTPPPASISPSSSSPPAPNAGSPATTTAPGPSPAGAQAGQPGGPPPPPASATGASGTVGPGGSAGPPSGFGGGQLLRLLQESVARRQHLDGRLRELQERMGRLEADVAGAQAVLQAAQGDQSDVVARAAATSLALARTEAQLHRAEESGEGGSTRPEMPTLRPIGIVQPGLLSLPVGASATAARPSGPETPGVEQLLTWQRELADQARRQTAELVEAQGRTAAADQAFGAALAPLEAERAVLAELRRELSAALSDPAVMLQGRSLSADGTEMARPSAFALTDIPADYLARYQRASATCPGLSWTVVAAIGSIESSHGRSTAPGVREGANFAGAMGPMQFLGPTWAAYGVDGNADGKRDVYLADDAVFGAANYLCASGAGDPARLPDAIWAYNHADWYVDQVLVLALRYGAGGLELAEASTAEVAELLANPNLTLSPSARADLRNGLVDQRLVNVLAAATANHKISVSVIKTGHSEFVAGTDRISNHFHGRGVDITAVDGVPVTASNDRALDLALAILTASPDLRPDELGSPWPGLSEFPGAFSDAAHQDHLHLGWS